MDTTNKAVRLRGGRDERGKHMVGWKKDELGAEHLTWDPEFTSAFNEAEARRFSVERNRVRAQQQQQQKMSERERSRDRSERHVSSRTNEEEVRPKWKVRSLKGSVLFLVFLLLSVVMYVVLMFCTRVRQSGQGEEECASMQQTQAQVLGMSVLLICVGAACKLHLG